MPFYPLKKIGAIAQTRQAYLRGVHGYNAGWVQAYGAAANAFYPEYVTASVSEGSEVYHIEVGFDSAGEAEYLECNCGQYHPGGGACKHIVAALVHKYYHDMVAQLPTAATLMHRAPAKNTDRAAQQLIDYYMTRESARLSSPLLPDGEQAVLTPILSIATGRPLLIFTIGTARAYLIKNLSRFFENMACGNTVEYGKQFCFTHREENFTPASRPLLRFLLGELTERASGGSPGELALTPAGFDRFFALMNGQRITLRGANGDQAIALGDGEPVLGVSVEKEPDGVRLWCEEVPAVSGIRTLYLLYHGTLCRTGEEYSRRMTEWVRIGARAGDGLFIAEAELPSFCAGVLNTVRPYIRLDGDDTALDAYRPRALAVDIYLDAPEDNAVTARVVYRYGDDTVEPFKSTDTPQPWRDPLAELRVKTAVQAQFTALQPLTGLLVLRGDDDRIYDFISRGVDELRRVATVYGSESFDRLTPVPTAAPTVGVSLISDLLEMEIDTAALDAADLTGIITGYREHRTYHRLKSGRFVALDDTVLSGLAELADGLSLTEQELRSGRITLPKYRALYLDRILRERTDTEVRRDERFCGLLARFEDATHNDYPVPDSLVPILRQYQRHGYRWLRTMEELGFGAILADDMGLGKTIQIITLLLAAKERGDNRPSLVVCPTSLVLNWEREIARFAPALTTLCVIGDAGARRSLLQTVADGEESYDVLITSYDMLKRDVALYEPLSFHYHMLDEAQYIKNSTTQNARAAKAVRAAQRFALTGTPMENRLSELWSIFDFLMPGILFGYAKFRARFETPIMRQGDERALARLGRMVSPFILRRLKQDVLTELPPKTEQVLPSTMEDAQRQVYLATLRELRRELEGMRGTSLNGQARINVLTMLTRLRQICCDPRLCCEGYIGSSCKLEACVELLKEASEGGHKVLLFSQFTSMLDLIRQRLEEEGISYYLLQGSTPKDRRAALVDAFNTDDTAVFLISLKAGGTGLNLTGADMVIHYDPWWNLAAQNQATDRAHRIGQKRAVQVVRLIARDTVEDKILRLQEDKRRLAEAVIDTSGTDIAGMSAEELLEILS